MTDEIIIDEAHRIQYNARVGAILDRWNKIWLREARKLDLEPLRDVHLEDAATLLGITYEEAYARRREPLLQRARHQAKTLSFGFRYAKPFTITDFKRYASGKPYLRHEPDGSHLRHVMGYLRMFGFVVKEQDRVVHVKPSVLLDNIVWEAFMRDIVVKSR
jgi:hypothetical protein